jgi:hypothetical protein
MVWQRQRSPTKPCETLKEDEMSDALEALKQELQRQIALLKFAIAYDAEQELQAVHERAYRGISEDRHINVHELKPLVPPGEPPPAVATTVPLGPPRDIALIDAVAEGFARRDRAAAIAEQLEIARKLKGL